MNSRPVRATQKNHRSFFIIETINCIQGLLPLQGVSILGNVPAAMRRASLCCPFRAIKSKIPRKDYGKTNIPLKYYEKSYFFDVNFKFLFVYFYPDELAAKGNQFLSASSCSLRQRVGCG
jgi:hypothetical protein